MNIQIRVYEDKDINHIVELSLLAWEPVFVSFETVMGPQIFSIVYPDWRQGQADGVQKVCRDQENYHTLVAEVDGKVIGFLTYELNQENKNGEVILLAVHPDYQNDGIGTELNLMALQEMRAAGMKLAVVGTGGDEGHAPARRAYEKAGYTPLPLVRYYQAL
jgi:GNAT superfamily N-acetyltransferase